MPSSADRLRLIAAMVAAAVASGAVAPAAAVDLTVASIQVTQGFQNGSTALVGGRAAMVRVTVAVSGSAVPIPGVDAVLRMFVDGVEWPHGPFFSQNGPITASLSPQPGVLDHTLNFIVVPPIASSVVFKVLVNPTGSVVESNTSNNLFTSASYAFACRAVVDLAYVPINYEFGDGLPDPWFMEPGIADNFLRGIFAVGEWNYHRSPLGELAWKENVDGTAGDLLVTLMDIREALIPGAGYAKPEFVYGFLPGNPYSGNGLANGMPGTVAFGNTTLERWQRTFAHEIGHLWGMPHIGLTIGSPQIDVEHHLKDPLNLGPLHAANKWDVMVAGMLTPQAWVASITYNTCLNDARAQCSSLVPPWGSGDPDSDSRRPARRPAAPDEQRCLRIGGQFVHDGRQVSLRPVTRFERSSPTRDDPDGDLAIEALGADGRVLHRVRVRTDTMRESCAGDGSLNPVAPIHLLIPEEPRGARVDSILVRDLKAAAPARGAAPALSGPIVARIDRSPMAPVVSIDSVAPVVAAPAREAAGWSAPLVEIRWSAIDPDGGSTEAMLLYSPDGGDRWAPVTVRGEGGAVRFDPRNLPGARPGQGLLRLRVSDGLNITELDAPIDWMFLQDNPPDVHIISPNAETFRRGASVVLHASGWDMEDEYLPNHAFHWSSDLDGHLGVGRLFITRSLSPGSHIITLVGADSAGNETVRTIPVTVLPRPIPTADLNGDGVVDGADLGILLGNWGGYGAGDLTFDGVVDGADLGIVLGGWS